MLQLPDSFFMIALSLENAAAFYAVVAYLQRSGKVPFTSFIFVYLYYTDNG